MEIKRLKKCLLKFTLEKEMSQILADKRRVMRFRKHESILHAKREHVLDAMDHSGFDYSVLHFCSIRFFVLTYSDLSWFILSLYPYLLKFMLDYFFLYFFSRHQMSYQTPKFPSYSYASKLNSAREHLQALEHNYLYWSWQF